MLPAPDPEPTRVTPRSILLWTGPKHSGKTSSAARLVAAARGRGFTVAGCLAPSVYAGDVLLGFDLVNLRSGARAPLARRNIADPRDRSFHFLAEGLGLGEEGLGLLATGGADLIVIDEYGPQELKSELWRRATDRLMTSTDAVLLLVVRDELADAVQRLYAGPATGRLAALTPESVDQVLAILETHRRSSPRPQ
jgi:nucleoside-triphosphatase THEP1